MDIRNGGHREGIRYFFEDPEGFLIPDPGKGVHPAPVGFLEASLEHIGNLQPIRNADDGFSNAQCHILPFNGAGA